MTDAEFNKIYPLHAELKARLHEAQAIGAFLDWLDEQELVICRLNERTETYYPSWVSKERRIGDFMEIDPDKLDDEKRAMLSALTA